MIEIKNMNNAIMWEHSTRIVAFKPVYYDITENLNAALVLSQIMYWYRPDHDGKSKLRVKQEGKLWLVKSDAEWWDEIRISPRQASKAITHLVNLGIVEKKIFKFAGVPKTHIRIIESVFVSLLEKAINNPMSNPYQNNEPDMSHDGDLSKSVISNSPTGEMDLALSGKSFTENTTDNTHKTTPASEDAGVDGPNPSIMNSFARSSSITTMTTPEEKRAGKRAIDPQNPKPEEDSQLVSLVERVLEILSNVTTIQDYRKKSLAHSYVLQLETSVRMELYYSDLDVKIVINKSPLDWWKMKDESYIKYLDGLDQHYKRNPKSNMKSFINRICGFNYDDNFKQEWKQRLHERAIEQYNARRQTKET